MQSNFERWQYYMKDFPSPQSFVDMSFYYIINATLARKIWVGDEHNPLYPNLYMILVGEAGIGKGLVIKQVEKFLKFHRRTNPNATPGKLNLTTEEQAMQYTIELEEYEKGKADAKGKIGVELPLRLAMAPNATTYEALMKATAMASRSISYKRYDEVLQKEVSEIYTHKSLAFCLEELASIIQDKKRSKAVIDYMLQAYDCGDYRYETKNQGIDDLRKLCLNLFAGTTPHFMKETLDDRLLNEGFASRTIFVFADKNRHEEMFMGRMSPEQLQAKAEILTHTAKLLDIYGEAKFSPEALEFFSDWYRNVHPKTKNSNFKLKDYYARKRVHVQKIAMAIHFGESTDMTIGVESCQKAVDVLYEIEKRMHHAISFDGKNPLARVARKVIEIVKRLGPQSYLDLFEETFEDAKDNELKETIEFLTSTNKLHLIEAYHKDKGNKVTLYNIEPTWDDTKLLSRNYKASI